MIVHIYYGLVWAIL